MSSALVLRSAPESVPQSLTAQGLSFSPPPPPGPTPDAWSPQQPNTLEEAGLTQGDVEGLILKQLLNAGATTGRKIADQLRLPFGSLQESLRVLKGQLLVNYRSQAAMGDFEYELTADGEKRAEWHAARCTYSGAAPVPLADYIQSVEKQTIRRCRPRLHQLCEAFRDLSLAPAMISQLGQAAYGGRGLFLYGKPGNGKTSIAERIVRALDPYVWIPRTITVSGEIIRLFDSACHEEAPLAATNSLLNQPQIDRRWVRIKRPSVVVGGELRMEQLEVQKNQLTGILEAPLQLKSNCGALVVDDFGRQRMSTSELLNRWIIPLEKRFDYLSLPSGRQIQTPFDQLLVFSTNLEPQKLVDEAFLRRIPYKIRVADPSPREFCDLLLAWCNRLELEYSAEAVEYLLTRHYAQEGRPLRYCHPRDLLQQVRIYCEFHELPPQLTPKALDIAAATYFAGLDDLDAPAD